MNPRGSAQAGAEGGEPMDERTGGKRDRESGANGQCTGKRRREDAEPAGVPEDDQGGPDGDQGLGPRVLRGPARPTAQEVAEHRCTPIPYRSWYRARVFGQCPDTASRTIKDPGDQETTCRIGMDYMFLSQRGLKLKILERPDDEEQDEDEHEGEGRNMITSLAVKDFKGEAVLAYTVRAKGLLRDAWIIDQLMSDLDTLGMNAHQLIVKCDHESAIIEVQGAIQRRRASMDDTVTLIEHSRVGDGDSNGKVERAAGEVAAMVRTLRAARGEKVGEPIGITHPEVPWMIRHACELITRFRVRTGGRTAYRRANGYDTVKPVVEFGEAIWFKPFRTARDGVKIPGPLG